VIRRVLLGASTRRDVGARQRLQAASEAGITEIGLSYRQVVDAAADGVTLEQLVAMADGLGVRIGEFELLGAALEPDRADRTAAFAERLFSLAARVGAERVIVVSQLAGYPDEAAIRLRPLCDAAADHGLVVALEFAPWTEVPNLRTAAAIVEGCGRPNAAVVLDAWHFFRGGSSIDDIEAVPPSAIACVQLSDGPATGWDDPYQETRHGRLVPGAGSFALEDLVRKLDQHGYAGPWSIEVLADALETLSPAAAFAGLAAATRSLLDGAT
jgi:sugar phosphate isomerase/epimerase